MKNKIIKVGLAEIGRVIEREKENESLVVEVHGEKIRKQDEFLKVMKQKFSLPDSDGWDSFFDWMTDLSWISANRICIVIYNYNNLFVGNALLKAKVADFFVDILRFWDTDVLNIMVGGEVKSMNVYLVNC